MELCHRQVFLDFMLLLPSPDIPFPTPPSSVLSSAPPFTAALPPSPSPATNLNEDTHTHECDATCAAAAAAAATTRWSCLGVCGSLLGSLMAQPLYLATLTVSMLPEVEAAAAGAGVCACSTYSCM